MVLAILFGLEASLVTITEPTTMLTDYLLTLACFGFAGSIRARARLAGGRRVRVWSTAFVMTGVAALVGGTSHGFRVPLGEHWSAVWQATVAAIALGAVLLIGAGIRSAQYPETTRPKRRDEGLRWLRRAVIITLVAVVVVVSRWSLHAHFNHNDLYHVIQLVGLYCLYRGVLELHELRGFESEPRS